MEQPSPPQDPNPPDTAPPPAPPSQQQQPPPPKQPESEAAAAAAPPLPPTTPTATAATPLPATAAPKPSIPPSAAAAAYLPPFKSKKRPLDSNVQLQDCTYFKIRAVLKDIRPHLLEVLRTVDFRNCKGADELRQRLKLLMELYKELTAEAFITKKPKNEPGGQHLSSENGAAEKPQKQLQDVKPTEQLQSDHVFAKPSEKEAIHLEEQSCYIGGSAFGWNFITFPGSKPVFYGRTKEAFRAAQDAS
ncbi:neural Wiskott-Aldrich syndrome protein [Ricinus communis]|uniref:Uncharacterized protein n=1 Tax=Ricinus communis TaxID=3988 RepID=B9RDQ7_RICCO|nr:neural Wiskott-Aldrich syndrome protein [Ricinus communis]EEF50515.1 conserved hypothetical protein [Ricinus communis]|eukprot:XP_002511846.1 neural Wiskott-Aldrich syndrome protein [Ricinus communis]